MSSNALTRCWYAALAALATFALVGTAALAIEHHRSLLNFFSYFTVQSNILVAIVAVLIVLERLRDTSVARALHLAALTGITVTCLVYATVIAPHTHPAGMEEVYDVIHHYLVPALAVLGFLLLGPRMRMRRTDLAFMIWPAAWALYTMVRGAVSYPGFVLPEGIRSRYPYEFLNVDKHGWGVVIAALAGVAVLLVALSCVYIWASDRLGRGASEAI